MANVCDYWLIDSVFEITFNKSKKSVIEKHAFQGGLRVKRLLGDRWTSRADSLHVHGIGCRIKDGPSPCPICPV